MENNFINRYRKYKYLLAFCKEPMSKSENYDVYFINLSDDSIESLELASGGCATTEDEILMKDSTNEKFGPVGVDKFVQVGNYGWHDLDFINQYDFKLKLADSEEIVGFLIGTRMSGLRRLLLDRIPVVNKHGYFAVPR